jgi:glutamine amidotransferase
MCRFIAYRGKPVVMDEILYQPKNSLIKQSAAAHEAEEPLNGDGFGVGWYSPEIDTGPGLYVSVRPAWNDRNLRYIGKHIRTRCLFAHVRAASEGEVSEANCHPFHFKNFLFMHNGGIGGFQKLKRQIRRKLSDEIYDWVRGQTDSEHLFALFLENLSNRDANPTSQEMADTLEATIREIEAMKADEGITEASYINCSLTDGNSMIAVRYVSDPAEIASTLYYAQGQHYVCYDGIAEVIPSSPHSQERAVLIVSEKLTERKEDWTEIPTNSMCIVDEKIRVQLRMIDDGQAISPGVVTAAAAGGAASASPTGKGFRAKIIK